MKQLYKNFLKRIGGIRLIALPAMLLTQFPAFAATGDYWNVGNLRYTVTSEDNATVYVTKGRSNIQGELVIPATVTRNEKTYYVSAIMSNAFADCKGITSVSLTSDIEIIGSGAFRNCTGLTSVTMPNSVWRIEDSTFEGCTALKSVVIGSSVSLIGSNAFKDCPLTEIKSLNDNPPHIMMNNAFSEDVYMNATVYVPLNCRIRYLPGWNKFQNIKEENMEIRAEVGESWRNGVLKYTVLSDIDATVSVEKAPYCTIKQFNIPLTVKYGTVYYTVTKIKENGFEGCADITDGSISNTITEIGAGAFRGCTGLTSLIIPNNVAKIGAEAFQGCTGLTAASICEKVNSGDTPAAEATEVGNSAFAGCSVLTSVSLGENVSSIGEKAFANCPLTEIRSLNIQPPVCAGSDVFSNDAYNTAKVSVWSQSAPAYKNAAVWSGFKNLTGVDMTAVGDHWTEGNLRFTVISVDDATVAVTAENKEEIKGNIVIPASTEHVGRPYSVAEIGELAFSNCIDMTSVTIPNSVTTIGRDAFSGCTGLTSLPLPNSITTIREFAFNRCLSLTSITLPNSVTTISYSAFFSCRGLTSITIPESITEIYPATFMDCTSLTSITLPGSITKIGNQAFELCTSLTSITIPESVTEIGSSAFNRCSSLTSITIPDGVTYLDSGTFRGCTNLTSVTLGKNLSRIFNYNGNFENCPLKVLKSLNPNAPELSGDFNDNIYENTTLYVPSASIDIYKDAAGWSKFLNIKGLDDAVAAQSVAVTAGGETSLKEGETVQLTATVAPDDASDKTIVWSTSDAGIATVDANGLVTAKGKLGTVTITATCGEAFGTIEITVVELSGIDSIFFESDATVSVCNLAGHQVYSGAAADITSAALAPGIYIVRAADGKTAKIRLR